MKLTRILLVLAFLLTAGCANLPNYKAEEVHQTTSYPLFYSKQIDAIGISKVTNPDGTVTRKAETATVSLQISGFNSVTVLKGAELSSDK